MQWLCVGLYLQNSKTPSEKSYNSLHPFRVFPKIVGLPPKSSILIGFGFNLYFRKHPHSHPVSLFFLSTSRVALRCWLVDSPVSPWRCPLDLRAEGAVMVKRGKRVFQQRWVFSERFWGPSRGYNEEI